MDDFRSMIGLGRPLAATSIVLATTIVTTAYQRPAPAPNAARAPQTDAELTRVGEQLTEKVCTGCHGLEDVYTKRRTTRDWSDVVTDMAGRGATATDDQLATIKRYLTRSFGIVSINTAPAEELSAVLGLSSKDAAAIVAYRKIHGNFADVAALSKIEGIDKAKITAQSEAITFK